MRPRKETNDRVPNKLKESIRKYSENKNKQTTNKEINTAKSLFFKEILNSIENNTLTVSSLTDKVNNKKNRDEIFYRGRNNGPSSHSHAARLIQKLYKAMGADISKRDLQFLIFTKQINTEKEQQKSQNKKIGKILKKIKSSVYKKWFKYPNLQSKNYLEYEIKCQLKLELNSNLADTILQKINKEFEKTTNEYRNSLSEKPETSEKFLQQIEKLAPSYLPELINDLYDSADEQNDKENLIEKLSEIVINFFKSKETNIETDDENKKNNWIVKSILNNRHIALEIVKKQPKILWNLKSDIQDYVHLSLLNSKNKTENENETNPIEKIKEIAEEDPLRKALNENNQVKFIKELTKTIIYKTNKKIENSKKPNQNNFNALKKLKSFINKEAALKRIEKYLLTKPNSYKKTFFKSLYQKIKKDGLSYDTLITALNKDKDRSKLFAKWSGRTNSGAAQCFVDLIDLVDGRNWKKEETNDSILQRKTLLIQIVGKKNEKGKFPDVPKDKGNNFDDSAIQSAVSHYLKYPHLAKETKFGRLVDRELKELGNKQRVLQRVEKYDNFKLTKKIELTKAVTAVIKNEDEDIQKPPKRYDPQGRVLVTLKNADKKENLICNIDLMGDSAFSKTLLNQFKEKIKKQENTDKAVDENALKNALSLFEKSPGRGSIIPLQAEMEMHIFQLSRVLEKEFKTKQVYKSFYLPDSLDFKDNEAIVIQSIHEPCNEDIIKNKSTKKEDEIWDKIRDEAANKINAKVLTAFRKALVAAASKNQENLNIAKLNEALDTARAELEPLCKKYLVEAISNKLGETVFSNFYSHINTKENKKSLKESLKSTSATGLQYLHTNNRNQTLTLISPTETTAHAKKTKGENKQAFRIVKRFHFNIDNADSDGNNIQITPFYGHTTEARVPAIPVDHINHNQSAQDVADKLEHTYALLQEYSGGHTGPMIYNLLLSLRSKPYDAFTLGFWTSPGRKNRERLRSARIMKGTHVFNRRQIDAGNIDSLCFIQQIPVNQKGLSLTYNSNDHSHREATLMTDMALFSTLSEHAYYLPHQLSNIIQRNYLKAQEVYQTFLTNHEQGNLYFSDSKEGAETIHRLEWLKSRLRGSIDQPVLSHQQDKDYLQLLVTRVLAKLMGTLTKNPTSKFKRVYAHRNLQYGTLIQSLSVFLETMSQTGCKSANERYQMVAGRVELLHSIAERYNDKTNKSSNDPDNGPAIKETSNNPLSVCENNLIKSFESFLEKTMNDTSDVSALQCALDNAYNAHNLQGSCVAISLEDQGGPSKVSASKKGKNGRISEMCTNVAETNDLKNLSQKNSKKFQAHKGDHIGDLLKLMEEKVNVQAQESQRTAEGNRFN